MLVGYDAACCAGDCHELADLEIAMCRQRHHGNRADLLKREIEIDELDAVRELYDKAVERPDAEIEEIEREVCGAFIQLRVADLDVAIEHGNAVGIKPAIMLPD